MEERDRETALLELFWDWPVSDQCRGAVSSHQLRQLRHPHLAPLCTSFIHAASVTQERERDAKHARRCFASGEGVTAMAAAQCVAFMIARGAQGRRRPPTQKDAIHGGRATRLVRFKIAAAPGLVSGRLAAPGLSPGERRRAQKKSTGGASPIIPTKRNRSWS